MPAPPILKVNEIFWSAQGEGARSGLPAIFVRLAGCSLRCVWCDTQKAWDQSQEKSAAQIIGEVEDLRRKYPDSGIVLTGGEPLEQELGALVAGLKEKNFPIAIETNGLHFQDLAIDWWTVSPKEAAGFRIEPLLIPRLSEIKLVVTANLDIKVLEKIRLLSSAIPIFLQPQAFSPSRLTDTLAFYEQCQRAAITNVRLGLRLHKMYSIR